ncbi:MAG: ABC transporter substrate-binding protein [Thaumarchaeota archaeon]|nr:ABC transporter substrate-binding protein [Nitrososphaerota archaeon]
MNYRKIVGLILVFGFLLAGVSPNLQVYAQEQRRGPYLDEITFVHYLDEQIAAKEVEAGNIQAYFWRIPLEVADGMKKDPNVVVTESPGGMWSLVLNPVATEKFNPFSIREVRYALNLLVNREFLVNEILRGYGSAQIAVYGIYDPDYLVIADEIDALNIKYNPELANQMINDAMTKAAAQKVQGKWMMNNEPVTIKFFIRSDDLRRTAVGGAVASGLENAGFTVEKIFGDLTKAFEVVYGSDPKEAQWHMYTEGWGRSGFLRYDTVIFAQMYAPWFGNMPGWGEPSYTGYQHAELDDLSKRVSTSNFTSKAERDDMIRKIVLEGMRESVRIFLVSQIEPYVANKNFKGTVNDFGAGLKTRFTVVNGRLSDAQGGSVKIGMKQIYQGSWNGKAGIKDSYSQMIWNGLNEPSSWTNPHTGDIITTDKTGSRIITVAEKRSAETAGPKGRLDVPADALNWDRTSQSFKAVGPGVKATSKITSEMSFFNWHHGTPMNRADVLYGIYFFQQWGLSKSGEPTFDPEYTSQSEPGAKLFKGIRFTGDNRVEVYVDYWHFDTNYIADSGGVGASMPWEIDAASEKVVVDKKAAFSRTGATAGKVPWLSLIIKSDADLVKAALQDMKNKGTIPPALQGVVTREEATRRYDAAIKWIEEKGHAIISNGPFYLVGYNPDARTITIRRNTDPTYPIALGVWKDFEVARVAQIKSAQVPSPLEAGKPASVKINIDIGNQPSAEAQVAYRIVDGQGNTVLKGEAKAAQPTGTYEIALASPDTSKLSVGSYQLKLFATSPKAIKPDVYQTSFLVSPPFVAPEIPKSPTPEKPVTPPQPTVGMETTVVIGLVVAIIAVGAGIALARGRKKPAT